MASDTHPPAFQFYVKDFASDGRVELMSTEAVGAYMLLLCKAWYEDPVGTIPNDDSVLARWARMAEPSWNQIRDKVLAAFELCDDGRYHQKRMKREYAAQMKRRKERVKSGRKGAYNKWHRDGSANGSAMHGGQHQPMANDGSSSSSATALTQASPDGRPGRKMAVAMPDIPEVLRVPQFVEAWSEWLAYRAERKPKVTPRSAAMSLKELAQWGVENAIAGINHSIARGYQGIVPKPGAGQYGAAKSSPTPAKSVTQTQIFGEM